MKTITLKLIIAFLLVSNFNFAQNDWEYVNSTGTSFILFGMNFPPDQSDIGYACGMQYTYDADGVIVKTTDGGDNWVQIWPESGVIDGLQGIWFISDDIGFACGWNNYFIKTTDGGDTWAPITVGSNVWYYTDVEFWDEDNGVAAAYMNSSAQAVFITDDGGDTWIAATSGIAANLMGICYADENTLFAVTAGANVYKSTDGGHNWNTPSNLGAILRGVDFADTDFGVIGAEEKMFYTTDGGDNWGTYITGYENFYAIKAFSDGRAYVGGTDENIYFTDNYGSSWTLDNDGSGSSSLYRIRFTSNGTAFACGSQGTILIKEPALTADFSANPTTVCAGDPVYFTDQSNGAPISWEWTFEGGTPASSTEQNPTIIYNTPGVYDVELEVSDGDYNSTEQKTDYITVVVLPDQADMPDGASGTCTGEDYEYTTDEVEFASYYTWEVSPTDAGTIEGDGNEVIYTADDEWTGDFTIRVRAENICGSGAWSDDLEGIQSVNPTEFFFSGGGGYCEGGSGIDLTLDGSEVGVDYELYLNYGPTGTILEGTGSAITFEGVIWEGIYNVEGYTENCSVTMPGEGYINIIELPEQPGTPSGAGDVCNNGTDLYTTSGSIGASEIVWMLDPPEAGSLSGQEEEVTIVWDNSFTGLAYLSCEGMNDCGTGDPSDELEITVNTIPEQANIPSGATEVCTGMEYEYTTDEVATATGYIWEVLPIDAGTITGTGTVGTFYAADSWTGNFAIKVTAENDCGEGEWSDELQGDLDLDPTAYPITGGGGYCEGDPGIELLLENSETGVDYELYFDGSATGTIVAGNGLAISFGYVQNEGDYTAIGYSDYCSKEMTGVAAVSIFPNPTPEVSGLTLVCSNEEADYETDDNAGSTYEWVITGGDIVAGSGTHMITVLWGVPGTGYVNVTETNAEGCDKQTEDFAVTIDDCTGLNEISSQSFQIFPNPAKERVQITSDKKIMSITVYDNAGKILIDQTALDTFELNIDLSDFQPGIYMVRIIGDESEETHKLIKK